MSLPYQTYGLDVMAYIAQAHQGKRKQFKEIWQELRQGYGLEISEREVGLLYRRIEALQMGSQVAIDEKLRETVEKYGQLMMATDALEPDGGGPKLYVLHEILGGTVVSLAVIEQANEPHLSEWLAPYSRWQEWVTGTLSDNEQALVTAMHKTFTKAKHQLSQLHFVKNISEPLHEGDRALQKAIREEMGQLPPVPVIKKQTEAKEKESEAGERSAEEEETQPAGNQGQLAQAIGRVIDIISGVELAEIDELSVEEWSEWLAEAKEEPEREVPAVTEGQRTVLEVFERELCQEKRGAEMNVIEGRTAAGLVVAGETAPAQGVGIGPTTTKTSGEIEVRGPGGEPEMNEAVDTSSKLSAVSGSTQLPVVDPKPTYLSAQESAAWVKQSLLGQVPASVRVLVETPTSQEEVTRWEHTWYRRAIQDTRHQGSRKPFLCGGLRGYQQLEAITNHLTKRQAEQGLDPYLTKLHQQVQHTVQQVRPLAQDVSQTKDWLIKIERLLADPPAPSEADRPASVIQAKRVNKLLKKCGKQSHAGPTLLAFQHRCQQTHQRWQAHLYHYCDLEGLPRSNLGVEALFGAGRRQQRRVSGQTDTSPLAVTGQGYLRATSADQGVLLELFQQVPVWIYRLALQCVEAIEASVRWPRQLHRNTPKALQKLDLATTTLRQKVASPPDPTPA